MAGSSLTIAGVFALGVLLAILASVGLCATLGGLFLTVDRLSTRCPRCSRRRMRQTQGVRTSYPGGRGTGRFYLCRACGGRWFWSNDERNWEDASTPDRAWAFEGRKPGRG